MLPHEYQERANQQSDEQTKQLLSWEAWCRVLNAKMNHPSDPLYAQPFKKGPFLLTWHFEVRMDAGGKNFIHLGVDYLNKHPFQEKEFFNVLLCAVDDLEMKLGKELTRKIYNYLLFDPQAQGLYALELLAGGK